jgi:hypothetical protein
MQNLCGQHGKGGGSFNNGKERGNIFLPDKTDDLVLQRLIGFLPAIRERIL